MIEPRIERSTFVGEASSATVAVNASSILAARGSNSLRSRPLAKGLVIGRFQSPGGSLQWCASKLLLAPLAAAMIVAV